MTSIPVLTRQTHAAHWLGLRRLVGSTALAFQKVEQLASATWPNGPHPKMLHLDGTVPNRAELDAAHQHALALDAQVLMDRSDDAEEPLWVPPIRRPPFYIFVVPAAGG